MSSRRQSNSASRRLDAGFTAVEVLTVAAVVAVIAGFAAPMMKNMLNMYRVSGDAHAVSNSVAMAKMRAASMFSQTRIYVTPAGTYRVETWQKTGTPAWVTEGDSKVLASGVSFGWSGVSTPPPNSQATIAQAQLCTDNAGATIANTACIVFNSRGLPVDSAGAPTAIDALYVTDGTSVYGITVSATGMLRLWRTPAKSTPVWTLQ